MDPTQHHLRNTPLCNTPYIFYFVKSPEKENSVIQILTTGGSPESLQRTRLNVFYYISKLGHAL